MASTQHPYANDAFSRFWDQSPRHASNATPLIDEGGELRAKMIAGRVLVPAPKLDVEWHSKEPVKVTADTDTFFAVAREQLREFGVAGARDIADRAKTDPRLATALRSLLAQPPATRDRILGRPGH